MNNKTLLLSLAASMLIGFGACKKEKKVEVKEEVKKEEGITVEQKQRSFIGYITATWCGPCGQYGGPNFKGGVTELGDDKIIAINLQTSSSKLTAYYQKDNSTLAAPLMSQFFGSLNIPTNAQGSFGIPAFSMNNVYLGGSSISPSTMVSTANTYNTNSPLLGVGAKMTISGNKITVEAKSKFYAEGIGTYHWSAIAYENKLTGYQLVGGTANENYEHVHAARASILANDYTDQKVFGEAINSGTVVSGTEFTKTFTFDYVSFPNLPAGLIPWNFDAANTKVAIMIWKKNGAKYEFVNGFVAKQ